MLSRQLKSLLTSVPQNLRTTNIVLGSLAALVVPVLVILFGGVIHNLQAASDVAQLENAQFFGGMGTLTQATEGLSTWLAAESTPLYRITLLLSLALAGLLIAAGLLYGFYRQLQITAMNFESGMMRQLSLHASQLAAQKTLSANQTSLNDCLEYHLPRVRSSLVRYWRSFPRHLVQLAACLVVMFLIHNVLAILSWLAAILVIVLYRYIDLKSRAALPIVRERAVHEREQLLRQCLKRPLLESIHDSQEVHDRFEQQLSHYRRDAIRSLTLTAWKTPSIIALGGMLGCLATFVVSVQLLRSSGDFSLAGAMTMIVCGVAAVVSGLRLQRTARELKNVEAAVTDLVDFLHQPIPAPPERQLVQLTQVGSAAELEHVTLEDSHGRKLLDNASLTLNTAQLIGVVSNHNLAAHALVELLMGFGRPVSGRLVIDGQILTDIDPSSLSRLALWIPRDGGLIAGTIRDNLARRQRDQVDLQRLEDAVRKAGLTESLRRLPDGFQTVIAPNDDRLSSEAAFRIGIARGLLRDTAISLIEEPPSRQDEATERETLLAMRQLVNPSRFTLVLPSRLSTLRECDRIVLIDQHRIAGVGTHAELLQQNDLYRHLNYLRYNPFQPIAQ